MGPVKSDALLEHVRLSLEQRHLMGQTGQTGQTGHAPPPLVVVAVSGGPDSLCLLHVLWRLRAVGGPALHAAHLDHRFRGEQSAAEAQFVAQRAAEWEIPATVQQVDVPSLIRATGQNKQAAARRVRYAFLARVAQCVGADAVAVAHQAEDQAETVLLHLLRGAGLAGLRGMRPLVAWEEWTADPDWRDRGNDSDMETPLASMLEHIPLPEHSAACPPLVRPLLEVSRAEIEAYCASHTLTPQHDPSNTSLSYTRNRIRAELLPHLAQFNGQIVAALGRTAQVCADDYDYIQQQLETAWSEGLVEEYPDVLRFSLPLWNSLPPVLQRYALRRGAVHFACTEELSYEQVETARFATTQHTGYQHLLAGGLVLQVSYDAFLLARQDSPVYRPGVPILDPAFQQLPQLARDDLALDVPGVLLLSDSWRVESSYQQPDHLPTDGGGRWRWWVVLDADSLQPPLVLRRRRAGERFTPAGGPGTKRLQDFFVDQKIPRPLREGWPLLATPTRIVWVVGLRADSHFQATPETTRTLWVVFRREPPIILHQQGAAGSSG
jgi:tRNA(Ile)-lysidine synthetase-like protein